MSKIGILGAGTWGTALAIVLSGNNSVTVWSALASEINLLNCTGMHPNLPGISIPKNIEFTESINDISDCNIIIFAVPSVYMRSTVNKTVNFIKKDTILVSVSKGIEKETLFTMTQVIEDEMQKNGKKVSVVALSGPTHAEEVAFSLPTTIVAASSKLELAQQIQSIFQNTCIRAYTNFDVTGVQLCGAVKNIIALAVGITDGLGYGDNTKAAIMTRGMAELRKLGIAMGCYEQTFLGLAGMGDLFVTATSVHSRNYKCGRLIGCGVNPLRAIEEIGMVVEGINALDSVILLSIRYNIDMPIVKAVDNIINHGADIHSIENSLMNREMKSEIDQKQTNPMFWDTYWDNKRSNKMRRVITYGTLDMLHYGHINILRRAKAFGDYLIVVLSTDEFNWNSKHKKCYFTYEQRKALLESIRYVDLVIPENNWEQKINDVHEYHIDTFVMGDDWEGKFDFLKDEGVDVVYLPRTPEISTTQIKNDLHNS